MDVKYRIGHFMLLGFLMMAIFFGFSACRRTGRSPNVVVMVVDTLRKDHLEPYGYTRKTSPFLAELAAESTVFTRAFSASSWTAPATASIFTSLYPFQHGVTWGFFLFDRLRKLNAPILLHRIPHRLETLAEAFKRNGYATYGIADNFNISDELGFSQGFDKFKYFCYIGAQGINSELKKWAAEIKSKRKYFLYIHYNDPHVPYHSRKPWFAEQQGRRENEMAKYDSEINYVDQAIREIFNYFDWQRNTLLVFTADHGEEFWEHGNGGHGKSLYAEVIDVPLIFYFPEKERRSRRIDANVSTIDILPTLREYLDFERNPIENGFSLLSLIRTGKPGKESDRTLFSHIVIPWVQKNRHELRASIHGDWKYIFSSRGSRELYQIRNDPGDKINLYDKHKQIAVGLARQFRTFLKRCKKFRPERVNQRLDKEKIDHLKTLGYVN